MNRRRFIQTAALAACAPRFSGAVPAANSNRVSLGFSLYGMKTLPVLQALDVCAAAGYSHVELVLNSGYATHPDAFSVTDRRGVARKLRELGLSLPCLMAGISLTADDAAHAEALKMIVAGAKVGRDLAPETPVVIETVLGGKPGAWELQKEAMAGRLRDWAGTAEKAGAVIALKAHVASAVNSPERLLWLLEQVPSPALQVAYDYSHFELQGIGMEESLRQLLPRTRFIHVKDSMGDQNKFQFLLPGEGRTNYAGFFSLLQQFGYTGPVCVEVSGQIFNQPGYDPAVAAQRSYAALSAAVKQSGGKI
jgi:sugar phosphate isomerase/epimerase